MNGLIIVDKPLNYTSRDVVNLVTKYTGEKRVGHTGTLDPLASGVLIVLLGKYTKLAELITAFQKEYIAKVHLGVTTDTLDSEGKVIQKSKVNVTKEEVILALKNMIGPYLEEVPLYSAIKVNGQKLYQYALKNEEVVLPKKEVTIYDLKLVSELEYFNDEVTFSISARVSKGTYIRSLIRDLAFALNTVGYMEELVRTRQGDVTLDECYSLEDIKNGNYELSSPLELLKRYETYEVNEEEYLKVKNGALLLNQQDFNEVILTKDNQILAIYKKYEKDPKYLKPWKMF